MVRSETWLLGFYGWHDREGVYYSIFIWLCIFLGNTYSVVVVVK